MTTNPVPIEASAALTMPQRAAVALGESANAAKLRELAAQSAGIVTVTNADGRAEAHRAGMVLVKTRTGITAKGKVAREDATAFSKAVIAMEKDLIAIIQPEEDRVLALRDAFDAKVAAEKAEAERIEAERVAAIRAKIADISSLPVKNVASNSTTLHAVLSMLAGRPIMEDEFAELTAEARAAVDVAGRELESMYGAAKTKEQAESDRLAEIEAQRVAMAAQAEANRVAAEQLAAEQRTAAEAKRQLEAQQAAMMLAQQQQADAARKEEARMEAARVKLAAEVEQFEQDKADAAAAAARAAEVPTETVLEILTATPLADPVSELRVMIDNEPEFDPLAATEPAPDDCVAAKNDLRQSVRALLAIGVGHDGVRSIVEQELAA